MSILIKGLEMPSDCDSCFIPASFCPLWINTDAGSRHPDCPLVPIPPHGRLIDADELEDSFEPSDFWSPDAEDNCFAAVRIVYSAPTIIPADDKDINVLCKKEGET